MPYVNFKNMETATIFPQASFPLHFKIPDTAIQILQQPLHDWRLSPEACRELIISKTLHFKIVMETLLLPLIPSRP